MELYGDVNFDGTINVNDIIIIINFILHTYEPTIEEYLTSDMNQDNSINILDVILVIDAILNPLN